MSTGQTSFTPGGAVAVCGADAWMVVQLGFDDPRLGKLWSVLSASDRPLDAVIETLLTDGLATMPAFASATSDGATTRVVVRHPAVVDVTVDGTTTRHSATPGGTWTDITVPGAAAVVLRADADTETTVQLPIHSGMTPAGAVTITLGGAVVGGAAAGDAVLGEAAVGGGSASAPEAAEPALTEPVPSPGAMPAPSTFVEPAPEAAPPASTFVEPAPEAAPPASTFVEVLQEASESEPEPEPESDPLAERAQTFHALLTSDTTDRDALLAQMAEEPDEDTVPDSPVPQTAEEQVPAAVPASPLTAVWNVNDLPPAPEAPGTAADEPKTEGGEQEAAKDPAPASSSGLIDGVPWLKGDWKPAPPAPRKEAPAQPPTAPPVIRQPAPPVAPEVRPTGTGGHGTAGPAAAGSAAAAPAAAGSTAGTDDQSETRTVTRAELMQSLGAAGVVGPSVLAVYCPAGHTTAAHEPTCRLCGAPVPEQEPRQIARPALGAIVLANGDRLVLDKDVVLGRAPYEPEGATERPHLLRLGDSGEISRQHARIILDGWHVIVRDLGAANGTTLTLPGGSAQQLRANEDYQLEDGAEIGIADVVTLRYEVKP